MESMFRILKLISFSMVIIIMFNSVVIAANYTSQKNSVDANIKNTQNKLEQTRDKKDNVMDQIQNLEEDLEVVNGELDNINESLRIEQEKLSLAELKLKKAVNATEDQKEKLKQRIRYMYETPKTTYIELLLKSKDFNQLYNRSYYINQIVDYDKTLVNKLVQNVSEIDESKKEIEKSKLAVQLLKTEQLNKKHAIEQTKEKKGEVLVDLTEDEKQYIQELNDLEKQSKKLELKIQQQLKGSTKKYVGGKFTWPVPNNYRISSPFGYRIHPISKEKKLHTGVDIPAATGSKIAAAADGTVLSASYITGYGYTVIINHGSGITTLYGHNSELSVNKGDEVKKGTQIAKAGSTGYSTGPHCHFEVRVNGTPVNPMGYFK
ncbi:MAG: hypothetical protein A2Y24_03840 [Clostridiales bacterium GWE2_32_10]|nr:MAG: hypothetical protein A2Y24_03840 [Clostridiales bacterium GWE2_32_10]HBY19598.1 metalloendopeptidase [Clostridiales bacterium]